MSDHASQTEAVTVEVSQDGETFTLTAAVPAMERREERDFFGDRIGLDATLELTTRPGDRPTTFGLSRLVGEEEWIIDSKFGPTGFPHWSHGFGARYLRLKTVLPEVADVLDTAARDRGLAQEIGRGIPLALADA